MTGNRRKQAVLEGELRSLMRDESRFPLGTVSFCEPGLGSDTGLPDTWVAVAPRWVPLELKRGPGVVSELRPTQRRWHKTSLKLGIPTWGATILKSGEAVRLYRICLSGKDLAEELACEFELPEYSLDAISIYLTN